MRFHTEGCVATSYAPTYCSSGSSSSGSIALGSPSQVKMERDAFCSNLKMSPLNGAHTVDFCLFDDVGRAGDNDHFGILTVRWFGIEPIHPRSNTVIAKRNRSRHNWKNAMI